MRPGARDVAACGHLGRDLEDAWRYLMDSAHVRLVVFGRGVAVFDSHSMSRSRGCTRRASALLMRFCGSGKASAPFAEALDQLWRRYHFEVRAD